MPSNSSKTVTSVISRTINPSVQAQTAYAVASAVGMVKLDVMENPYRLPQHLREELASLLAEVEINRYPDPTAPALMPALRRAFNIPDDLSILIGNGSDELISIITASISQPGASVMALEPTFALFKAAAVMNNLPFHGVSLNADFSLNLPATLQAIATHQPALLWLVYPNNPTGTLLDEADLLQLIAAAPGLVVVDEAYYPFARTSMAKHIESLPNLLVMRTVSKMGMAGLRLGYALGHPAWVNEIDKVRPPYNVSNVTQAAVAFVLGHHHLITEQADWINAERERLAPLLAALPNTTVFPSKANFLLCRFADGNAVFAALIARKILVRNFSKAHPLLANCLRITVGTPEENKLLLSALTDILS
jgi:histidinol-phosphate aminotransferase